MTSKRVTNLPPMGKSYRQSQTEDLGIRRGSGFELLAIRGHA